MESKQTRLVAQVRQSLHDINGAFTGVMGLAEYLEGEDMDPRHKELMATLVQSCEKMSLELNQLRSFMDDYIQENE